MSIYHSDAGLTAELLSHAIILYYMILFLHIGRRRALAAGYSSGDVVGKRQKGTTATAVRARVCVCVERTR